MTILYKENLSLKPFTIKRNDSKPKKISGLTQILLILIFKFLIFNNLKQKNC